MGRDCRVTGRKTTTGNSVSHSNRKTRRKFKLNLVSKRVFLEDENRWVRLTMSTRAYRTLRKKGLKSLMADHDMKLPAVKKPATPAIQKQAAK